MHECSDAMSVVRHGIDSTNITHLVVKGKLHKQQNQFDVIASKQLMPTLVHAVKGNGTQVVNFQLMANSCSAQ